MVQGISKECLFAPLLMGVNWCALMGVCLHHNPPPAPIGGIPTSPFSHSHFGVCPASSENAIEKYV